MHHASTSRHPLHVAGEKPSRLTGVAMRVLMHAAARQHVSDGLETAVRMVRRSDGFTRRILHRTKFVDQQERINLKHALHGKGPVHEKAAALFKILGREHERNFSLFHIAKNPLAVARGFSLIGGSGC